MWEMAELIVNWDMCACGCILETPGEWFPRACSKGCGKDFSCLVGR